MKKEAKLEPVDPKPVDKDGDGIPDYEVDGAVEDLLRAEKHKKNSKLMAKVHERLGAKTEAIKSIQGLKAKRAKLQAEE